VTELDAAAKDWQRRDLLDSSMQSILSTALDAIEKASRESKHPEAVSFGTCLLAR
jgi:hypothetical protein